MGVDSKLISLVISAKDDVNQPSFKKLFCSRVRNIPARDHSVFVSCWAFSYSFLERVLGWTYIVVHEDTSGFFYAQTSASKPDIHTN